jgi:hypothetical protein
LNGTFDGDELALYIINDQEALKEMEEKAFLKNTYFYDSDHSMLASVRHEALYAAYILTKNPEGNKDLEDYCFQIENLQDLPEDLDYWDNGLDVRVYIVNEDKFYSYGICLLNKWLTFEKVIINYPINKKNSDDISITLYNHDKDNYYDLLHQFTNKLFFFISSTNHNPTIDVEEMVNLLSKKNEDLFKKLPEYNPYLGYYLNEALVDRCIENMHPNSDLNSLYRSGSRMSKQQLSRTCINIGYVADAKNIILPSPICSNLMKGLDEDDYFKTGPGSRKGIIDKSEETPNSGYLERTMTMALGIIEIVEEDCETDNYIELIIFSEKHAKSLVGKYYKLPDQIMDWEVLDLKAAKSLINNKIYIRSPMTCQTPNFRVCQKCFGKRDMPTKYVGVSAGQIISERLTQLIMRSFHTSGSATLNINEDLKNFIKDNLIDIIHEEKYNIYKIVFKTNNIPEEITEIIGYKKTEDNIVFFNYHTDIVRNIDAIAVMNNIKKILKTDNNVKEHPVKYYEGIMEHILSVGTPYSGFVELMLCNMFLTNKDPDNKEFWRYNPDQKAIKKFGDKNLANNLSSTLGCLFQPNKNTLQNIKPFNQLDVNKLSIHEKLWIGHYE